MNELEEGSRFINGVIVNTWKTEISECNIIAVEAGTNGYHGGDTGHGSRTYIRIEDKGGTDIDVKVTENNVGKAIEFVLGGDSELSTIIKTLEFAIKILKIQTSLQTPQNKTE
jgi:hypothetical protein